VGESWWTRDVIMIRGCRRPIGDLNVYNQQIKSAVSQVRHNYIKKHETRSHEIKHNHKNSVLGTKTKGIILLL